jgi:quinoprotein glucose dehydrogenase
MTIRLEAPRPLGSRGPAPATTTDPGDFLHYNAPYDFMQSRSSGLPAISPPWSQLTAYDLNTGAIKWQIPNGGVSEFADRGQTDTGATFPRGGVVATAGGLIFVATASDRKIRAYDEDTGKVLWEKETPAGSEGIPAVYEVAGREYIAFCVAAGNGMMAVKSALPPGQNAYIVFALPRP